MHVAPILVQLAARHPKLELDLRFSDQLVDLIGEGFDLAIRNHNPGTGRALQARKITSQRKVVCATPEYLTAHGAPRDLSHLIEHEALVYWHRDQIYPWTFRGKDGKLIEPELKWRVQFDSYEAMTDAAVMGIGIACLPSWLVREHLEARRLVPILEEFPSIPFDTYAVWPAVQYVPMKLRHTIDTLVEELRWVGEQ